MRDVVVFLLHVIVTIIQLVAMTASIQLRDIQFPISHMKLTA